MPELKCDLCGKTFKNTSGLGGHKAALHGVRKPKEPRLRDLLRDAFAAIEHRFSQLEGRIVALERARLQAPLMGTGCKVKLKQEPLRCSLQPKSEPASDSSLASLVLPSDDPLHRVAKKAQSPALKVRADGSFKCRKCGSWHVKGQTCKDYS
jgi:hypothetical protein